MIDIAATIREALDTGLNLQALDLARSASSGDAKSAEIQYLGALASARMGAVDEAEKSLAKIDREALGNGPLAVDVWSLAGRIAKERFAAARDRSGAAARQYAARAIENYSHAHAISGRRVPRRQRRDDGDARGRHGAGAAARAAALLPRRGAANDYWHHATAGEALLVLGRVDEARVRYAEAYRLAGQRYGDIASMRRQLLLIGTAAASELGGHAAPAAGDRLLRAHDRSPVPDRHRASRPQLEPQVCRGLA